MTTQNTTAGYRNLIVWQKSDALAFQIYAATREFPRQEIFGLTSQIRRAALSVPTNIVEGSGRRNKGEMRQFLNIALGSLLEVEYLLLFCERLGYLGDEKYKALEGLRREAGALLWRLYEKIDGDIGRK